MLFLREERRVLGQTLDSEKKGKKGVGTRRVLLKRGRKGVGGHTMEWWQHRYGVRGGARIRS